MHGRGQSDGYRQGETGYGQGFGGMHGGGPPPQGPNGFQGYGAPPVYNQMDMGPHELHMGPAGYLPGGQGPFPQPMVGSHYPPIVPAGMPPYGPPGHGPGGFGYPPNTPGNFYPQQGGAR